MKKIFISFKKTDNFGNDTEDYDIANKLSSYLRNNGIEVFFSEISLAETQSSNYKAVIDNALDVCSDMIVVGTKAEFIMSPWVKYEWDTFLQDIISSIKPNGNIYCVFKNVKATEIPRGLRYCQTFLPTSEGFARLLDFLKVPKTEELPKKRGFICKRCGAYVIGDNVLGCSFHPENAVSFLIKNFDGTSKRKWFYPCCGKQVDDDGTGNPQKSLGCKSGFHVK